MLSWEGDGKEEKCSGRRDNGETKWRWRIEKTEKQAIVFLGPSPTWTRLISGGKEWHYKIVVCDEARYGKHSWLDQFNTDQFQQ